LGIAALEVGWASLFQANQLNLLFELRYDEITVYILDRRTESKGISKNLGEECVRKSPLNSN